MLLTRVRTCGLQGVGACEQCPIISTDGTMIVGSRADIPAADICSQSLLQRNRGRKPAWNCWSTATRSQGCDTHEPF